jgi:hypothetical protein
VPAILGFDDSLLCAAVADLSGCHSAVVVDESPRKSRRQFQLNPTAMAGFDCLS